MRWLLVGVLGVVAGLNAAAQSSIAPSRTPHADPRVAQVLDAGSIRYSIDDDGDYRIINRIDSTRTQLCLVLSRTSTYGKIEVRDVISVAYKIAGDLPVRLMQRLLEQNSRTKIGAWAIQHEGDWTIVLFRTQIAADAELLPLLHAVLVVTMTADELEMELTGTDEY
ncbi:MAG: hypothetical protein D6747_07925 [Chlorobiota bacterium]|jgi:hypothetical protein|nr:MAG: hypothetical protein D6747_07925 [Chlorobiota bacterium]